MADLRAPIAWLLVLGWLAFCVWASVRVLVWALR